MRFKLAFIVLAAVLGAGLVAGAQTQQQQTPPQTQKPAGPFT